VKWAKVGERWECIGLGIDFAPGARVRGLRTSDLRTIRMGEVLDVAASALNEKLLDEAGAGSPLTAEQSENQKMVLQVIAKLAGEPVEDLDRRLGESTDQGRALAMKRAHEEVASPKGGRTTPIQLTDDLLQEVADVYSAAQRDRQHPTKAVQAHFGGTKQRAAQWVFRARKAGKLPPTRQGEARGTVPRRRKEDS
jgi:hypothetical protein